MEGIAALYKVALAVFEIMEKVSAQPPYPLNPSNDKVVCNSSCTNRVWYGGERSQHVARAENIQVLS